MKMRIFIQTAVALAGLGLFWGCQQEQADPRARAVAASETYIEFASAGAEAQTLKVYSDGTWAVDVDSPWITVTPMTGEGHGEITVSVADNATGSTIDRPRTGQITIQGRTVERNTVITVRQDGDTYYGVDTYTLDGVKALDNDAVAKIADVQVVALSEGGAILSDGTGFIYVSPGKESAESPFGLGDKISLNGKKSTLGKAAVFVSDEVTVEEAGAAIKLPEVKDITAQLPGYDVSLTEYVKISASLIGTTIRVSEDLEIPILDPLESLGLAEMDLHKAVFTGFGVGGSMLVTAVEDGGSDDSLIPYPLRFRVRADGINYSTETWSAKARISPVQGLGYLAYVPYDVAGTDANKKYALDVNDKSPRVTGPWPGDYWLFYGNGAIKAGSEVRIAFETRTSATGHKFWLLEFLDGSEWRPAGETFTTSEPGEEVMYTHAMNADGSTNVQVDAIVRYRKNSDHAQFRFRCMANWQASGAGKLSARNGGSARITVTDKASDTYQPVIEMLKEGNGVERDPVYANIEVSTDLLTFNGTAGEPKVITVTSDHDFTLSSPASWLSFDVTEGLAGEETAIAVTCEDSELSELRQTTIKIVSEDSEKVINVVQSAAGQQLDPFVSISGGNRKEVPATQGTLGVKVQSNVEVSFETADSWISVTPVPSTKAMVEWHEYTLAYEANEAETPRTGTVRFFNGEANVETVFTLEQAGMEGLRVYFQDDFEWLAPWSAAVNAPDDVTAGSVGSAKNLFTVSDVAGALAEFQTRGYGFVWGWKGQDWSDGTPDNGNKQTLYLMKNYLKFGKTSYNSGIILPALAALTGPTDVELQFDWCYCFAATSGGDIPDTMTLTVEVSGGGTIAANGTTVSGPIGSNQPAEAPAKLEWQHRKVKILGATASTRITIRPTNTDPEISSARKQNRWYLDNVKVSEPEPAVPAVGDVLWEEWWEGGEANQKASDYYASDAAATQAFDGASLTYTTQDGTTLLKTDGLVFYNASNNVTVEKYRCNLLVSKGNGYLNVAGIPCKGVKTATLVYRSNTKVGVHRVTSGTSGVTVGDISGSQVNKLDVTDADKKYTNTLTCTITIPSGTETLELKIENTSSSSNIRVDGLELKVTEVY